MKLLLSTFILIFTITVKNGFATAEEINPLWKNNSTFQTCVENRTLMRLDVFNEAEKYCEEVVTYVEGELSISATEFRAVKKDWYRLSERVVKAANITTIQFIDIWNGTVLHDLVNGLPWYIHHVKIYAPWIYRLEKETLRHNGTSTLEIDSHDIIEITEDAIDMRFLEKFRLGGSRVNNTKFVKFLPSYLTSLDLTFNRITKIPARTFLNHHRLVNITLKRNQITIIEPGAFDNLGQLKSIDLSENNLTHLEGGVFINLPSLNQLNLQGNSITFIDAGTFDLPSLRMLNLRGSDPNILHKGTMEVYRDHMCLISIGVHIDCLVRTQDYNNACSLFPCIDYSGVKYLRRNYRPVVWNDYGHY